MLKWLHPLWQRLPAEPRRNFYAAVTRLGLPRPDADAASSPTGPWLVAGAITAPTGLGEAARLAIRALASAGETVAALDLSSALMQRNFVPAPQAGAPQTGSGTLLLFVNPPNVGRALGLIGARLLRGKRRIGCWVWELETIPRDWGRDAASLHEIAAPSRFSGNALAVGLRRPVRILSHPIAVAPPLLPEAAPDRPMTIGAAFDMGSTFARKNPLAVIEAYCQAFVPGDRIALRLKVRDTAADKAAYGLLCEIAARAACPIAVESGDLTAAEFESWWAGLDLFASLHRSEGFGLLVAEAMIRAIPVVSTAWSATAEYVDESNGYPIAAKLIPAVDASGRYGLPGAQWADADPAEAARAMRAAYDHPGDRKRRGGAARRRMLEDFNTDIFMQQLRA